MITYSRFSVRIGKKYIVYTYEAEITIRLWIGEYGRESILINPIGDGPL